MTNFEIRQQNRQRFQAKIDAANAEIAETGCRIVHQKYTADYHNYAIKPFVLYTGDRSVRYGSLDAAKAGAVRIAAKKAA